jgi:hypothetical protein
MKQQKLYSVVPTQYFNNKIQSHSVCKIVLRNGKIVPPETIRTVKILGGHLSQSVCIQGFVLAQRGVETTKTSASNAKIAVFGSGVEASNTKAKRGPS